MKLPSRVKTSVQPLAQISPGSVASAGMAMADAAFSIAKATAEIRQTKIDAETRDAGLYMANKMAEFEQKYGGLDYLTPDIIPEGVQYKRTAKSVDANGQLVEVERTDIPAYEIMPEVYKNYADTHAQAAADFISDERVRGTWLEDSSLTVSEQYAGRLTASRQKQIEFIEQKTANEVERAVDGGNYELARELSRGLQNAELKSKLNEFVTTREFLDPINDLIVNPDSTPEDIASTIELLSDPEFKGPISEQERQAKLRSLEASYERSMAHVLGQQERDRQLLVSDTWLGIDEGSPSIDESYIDGLFEQRKIDGGTRTAMIRALNQNRLKGIENELVDIDLDRIAAAGYGIDPKDKDMRAAVDRRFDRYINERGGDVWGSAEQVMKEFKVVPSRVIGMFRSANRAEAPELEKSVRLFMQAQDYAPKSLADFKDGEIDFIENVAANVRLGMDVPSAVQATNSYNSLTPQDKETLGRESKLLTETNTAKLEELVSDHPGYDVPWSPFSAKPNAFMSQEFDALVKRYLPSVGFNTAVAQNKAFSALAKSWSLTDVNGDWTLMKNMPQAPAADVHMQIKESFGSDLSALSEFHGKRFDKNSVKIFSDPVTQIQINNGETPTYAAFVVIDEETGQVEQLPRFKFDAKKSADLRKKQALEDARAQRSREAQSVESLKRVRI